MNNDFMPMFTIDIEAGVKGQKGDKGDKGDQGIQGIQGIQGEQGVPGIQGVKGDTGATGNGIASVEQTTVSHVSSGENVWTLTDTNGTTYDFSVENGEKGDKGDKGDKGNTGNTGPTGNGISTIEKTGTAGLVDTYTITYTNSDTDTFTVTNGADGSVTDVQVDGVSVVDNGVANITGLATQEELDRYKTIYNVLPKVTGEDETLTLNNTGNALMELNPKGNTSQTGTPTPTSPIPVSVVSGDNDVVVCGKNLFDTNWFQPRTTNGITATIEEDHLVLNGTSTGNVYINFVMPTGRFKDVGNYWYVKSDYAGAILHINNTGTAGAGSINITTTTSVVKTSNVNTYVSTGGYLLIGSGITLTNCKIYVDVRSNNIDVANYTYEPYTSQTYEVDLPVENIATSYMGSGNGYYNYNYDNSKVSKTMTLSFMPNFSATNTTVYARPSIDGTLYTLGNMPTITSGKKASLTFTLTDTQISEIKATTGGFFQIYDPDVVFTENYVSEVQLEAGTKANSYTEYGTTPIELCKIGTYQDYFTKNSGKNKLPQDKYIASTTTNGITYTNNGDGTFNLVGTASANTTIQIIPIGSLELMANQPYYLYSSVPYNSTTFNMTIAMTDNGSSKFILANNTYTPTATPTNERLQFYIASGQSVNAQNIKLMLVKGTTSPEYYEPYGTNQWCKYNAIGKVVLDGTQTLERLSTSQTGKYRYICKNIGAIGNNGSTTNGMFSDKVVETTRGTLYNCNQGVCYSSVSDYAVIFYLDDTSALSLADTYTYLATKPLTVYYILSTPYLSLIEDTNLIEQLDNLENAVSYTGQTNISQVNNDKAFIISAKALQMISGE